MSLRTKKYFDVLTRKLRIELEVSVTIYDIMATNVSVFLPQTHQLSSNLYLALQLQVQSMLVSNKLK